MRKKPEGAVDGFGDLRFDDCEPTGIGFASQYAKRTNSTGEKCRLSVGRWHHTSVVRMPTRLGMDRSGYGEPVADATNRWMALVKAHPARHHDESRKL
jgi:hypothetical protein